MTYASIALLGVLVGALCVYFCTPTYAPTEKADLHIDETEEDARLARQWQNILNYTADGGEDDAQDS